MTLSNDLGISTIESFESALHSLYKNINIKGWDDYKKSLLALQGWPLWIFLLVEARVKGTKDLGLQDIEQQLGPLGAQIFAEQIIWILQKDKHSYVHQTPDWHPRQVLPPDYKPVGKLLHYSTTQSPLSFSIADVINIAENGIRPSPFKN